MKFYYWPLVIFFTILLVSNSVSGQNKRVNKFIDEYVNVALWKVKKVNKPLMKWENKDTIRYRIYGSLYYLSNQEFESYIDEISELIQKKIVPTKKQDFDIILFFGTLRDYINFTGADISYAGREIYGWWSDRTYNEQYQLTYASSCIDPTRIKSKISGVYLVKQQFLRSLGILGGIEDQYSIFNKRSFKANKTLSSKDKRFIKLHYHPDVKAGLKKNELLAVLKSMKDLKTKTKEKL